MLYLNLDKSQKRSYTKQIYGKIRQKILSGELSAGEILPSTRDLCHELSVARNTVLSAYEMLVSEGAVLSVPGAGFYVSPGARHPVQSIPFKKQQTASLSDLALPDHIINFDSGLPALDLFPRTKWNRFVSHAFLDVPISALGYDDPQGRPEFRRVLCRYLKKTRGIFCTPEQIIVTSGTKQGLSIAAGCLLSPKSQVWMEDPSNANVKQIFSCFTSSIVPFRTDAQGIRPEEFPSGEKPDLIFTTPSHQFPMGGILSIQRRIKLVEFAEKSGAIILEDDYDSSFQYEGPPANSLFELDCERVIYAGTFSKIMFPSIRLGYLVAPRRLIPAMREIKRLADHHSNSVNQLAMMDFIERGEMEKHIGRMKKIYRKRRDLLTELLHASFGDQIHIHGAAAGMHIVVEFSHHVFTEDQMKWLLDSGVYAVPVERHALLKGEHENQIILGYPGLTEEEMRGGIEKIKLIISRQS